MANLIFWTSSLQNYGTINFCYFKPSALWYFSMAVLGVIQTSQRCYKNRECFILKENSLVKNIASKIKSQHNLSIKSIYCMKKIQGFRKTCLEKKSWMSRHMVIKWKTDKIWEMEEKELFWNKTTRSQRYSKTKRKQNKECMWENEMKLKWTEIKIWKGLKRIWYIRMEKIHTLFFKL